MTDIFNLGDSALNHDIFKHFVRFALIVFVGEFTLNVKGVEDFCRCVHFEEFRNVLDVSEFRFLLKIRVFRDG